MSRSALMIPTIINDNFFDDVDAVIKKVNSFEFHRLSKDRTAPGERTLSLHLFDEEFYCHVISNILVHYYGYQDLTFGRSILHAHRIQPGDIFKNQFHTDNDINDFEIAAVIYLSDGDIHSGTTILDDDKKQSIIVANKKNTMVAYDPARWHGPSKFSYDVERLTLTAFIKDVKLS